MAISWGAWQYDGSRRKRIGWEVTRSPSTITSATASITATLHIYLEVSYGINDSTNSFSVGGGTWSRSGSITLVQAYDTVVEIWSQAQTISLNYGSTQSKSITASLSGIEAIDGTCSVSGTYTVPARPYATPTATDDPTVTRVSDTKQTIAWVRNATTGAPYSSIKVQRNTFDGSWSGWATVATLSGTATSWSDTTTQANRAYDYRTVVTNDAGSATSGASGTVYTSPGTPSSLVASKTASGDIALTITPTEIVSNVDYVLEHSTDGGSNWSALTTLNGPDPVTTYTHASPSTATTHTYRVKAVTDNASAEAGNGLSSGWRTSNTVQLAAPPSAPTGLSATPNPLDADTDVTVQAWSHNPTDSSEQRKWQVQHRLAGDTVWTQETTVTSADEFVSRAAAYFTGLGYANGDGVEWQVRTWGIATTGGADGTGASVWSATATVTLSARPTATISAPADAGTVDTSTVSVSWAYYDAEGTDQSAWKAELLNDSGAVVETKQGAGTAVTATFATTLPDTTDWSIRVSVADADGLWSTADTVSFSVAYALPPVPTIVCTWDPLSGRVQVDVTNPGTSEGEVDAVSNDLYRSIDGGPWVKVAEGAPLDSTITDYAPTVAGSNLYRVDAISALPSSASSVETEVVTPQAGDGVPATWLSAGPALSQVCRAVANVSRSDAADLVTRTVRRYAGRTVAHEIAGVATARTWQVRLDYSDQLEDLAPSTPDEWLALAVERGPFLLRAPSGLYRWVTIPGGVSVEHDVSGAISAISFAAVETDGPAVVAYTAAQGSVTVTNNGDGTVTVTIADTVPAGGQAFTVAI